MNNFWLWWTWRTLGRPAPGRIVKHPRLTFPFEKGAEITRRLERLFGDLTQLSAIDLGCGPAESVVARQILEIPWRRLASVEAFLPYLNKLREKNSRAARHDVYPMRIQQVFGEFPAREFDLVLMIDVLEHFPRREGLRLLGRLERFAQRGIVLFSPVGEVAQEELDDNALQRHRSAWYPEDWTRLGYDVEVYEGFHGQLTPPATAAWAIKRLS
jgi:hypothetical protein